jgi:hypothetical protein
MLIDDAVMAFLTGYFSTCKRSIKTQAAYQTDLFQFKTHLGPAILLGDIGPDAMEAWAAALRSPAPHQT